MNDDLTFFLTREVVENILRDTKNLLQELSDKAEEITKEEYDQLGVYCKRIVRRGEPSDIHKLSSILRDTRMSHRENFQDTINCLQSLENALTKVYQKRLASLSSENNQEETTDRTLQLN